MSTRFSSEPWVFSTGRFPHCISIPFLLAFFRYMYTYTYLAAAFSGWLAGWLAGAGSEALEAWSEALEWLEALEP